MALSKSGPFNKFKSSISRYNYLCKHLSSRKRKKELIISLSGNPSEIAMEEKISNDSPFP